MYILILKKYWLEITFILSVGILITYINYLRDKISDMKKDNTVLQSKLNESNAYINTQNALILANKADYNASITKLSTELHKIDTKYITKTVVVEKWRDRNKTSDNLDGSIQYLNKHHF